MLQKLQTPTATLLWNKFTSSHPGIVPFSFNPSLFNFYLTHFNWKPYYILVFREDEVCAILPLINTGKAWVSLPHFSYGGMLLVHGVDNINIEKIIESISEKDSGYYSFDYEKLLDINFNTDSKIFIRSLEESAPIGAAKSEKVSSLIHLPDSSEKMMEMMNSNLMRKINKSKASYIVTKIGKKELLNDFYNVYSKNIHQLNSLNYSKSFFSDLINSWEIGQALFFVAYKSEKPVGTAMLLSYNGFYENTFFATLVEYRKEYLSDLLHWKMINYCIKNKKEMEYIPAGPSIYSFGRSTLGSGVYNFKNHWPVTVYKLFNYINFPDFRKNKWLLHLWAKLPLVITKPLGASLIKHIY